MINYLAAAIAVNAFGAIPWWIALYLHPGFRRWFLPAAMPDQALFSFAVPDLLLFTGAGLCAAYGLWRERVWASPALLLHTGAACYAALYTWQQAIQTNEAWISAAAMSPSLILLPYACWRVCRS